MGESLLSNSVELTLTENIRSELVSVIDKIRWKMMNTKLFTSSSRGYSFILIALHVSSPSGQIFMFIFLVGRHFFIFDDPTPILASSAKVKPSFPLVHQKIFRNPMTVTTSPTAPPSGQEFLHAHHERMNNMAFSVFYSALPF